jgi:phosphate transport system permease protein
MTDTTILAAAPRPAPGPRTTPRGAGFEVFFEYLCLAAATMLLVTLGGILVSLLIGGWPAFAKFGVSFFVTSNWDPVQGVFGIAALMLDTVTVALLALLIAVPISFGVAFFLVELCPSFLRRPVGTAVELLAGIPSIVYGMWGLFVFGPLFADWIEQPLMNASPPGSIWDHLTTGVPNGTGILAASIIVAMMVLPFIAATLRELLLTVPPQVRESAYGLGAATSEVVMKVTLPYVRRGAIGAVMLGLGRALGETMAVTFIIGNSHNFPRGLFDAGATIASTIANEFAEATSPMHTAALLASGFILFVITFVVLAMARMMIGQARAA